MEQQSLWEEHRNFLKTFHLTIRENDPLPVRVPNYNLTEEEIKGEIIHWSLQYLSARDCPSTLLNPIIRTVIERVKQQCQKSPDKVGYSLEKKFYQPIKLMKAVTTMVDEVCLRALDNAELDLMMPRLSQLPPKYESYAVKNGRRIMEDRHVVVDDFNGLFGVKAEDVQRTSFYAIFDGHGGLDAAAYSVSHLHYHLSESVHYPDAPAEAIKDAFTRTDEAFIQKNEFRPLKGGTTALCVLHRPDEKWLHVGWVGDTQALLVKNRKVFQTVKSHKADVESEQKRIARQGGACIMYNGVWRVNGQLAITRAIGDVDYKPYVTSEPEIISIPLDGDEDFLIMASDGLWDHVKEDDAAITVYNMIEQKITDSSPFISKQLVEKAKADGSTDNITIIIVFLKDLALIAKSVADWAQQQQVAMETEYANNDPLYASDQIITTAGGSLLASEEEEDSLNNLVKPSSLASNDLLADENNFYCDTNLNGGGCGVNITPDIQQSTTGKRPAVDNNEEEGDLGPETDVDAADEIMLSPAEDEPQNVAAKEEKQFEPKEIDASEESPEDYNPFMAHSNEDDFEVRQEIIPPMQHSNPFDIPVNPYEMEIPQENQPTSNNSLEEEESSDERMHVDGVSTASDYLNQNVDVTDDCEAIRKVPEFAEQQLPEVGNDEISFYGKNLETLQAFSASAPEEEKYDDDREMQEDVMDFQEKQEIIQEDVIPPQEVDDAALEEHLENIISDSTAQSECVVAELETKESEEPPAPAESGATIVESEEESDEEWNYIKGGEQQQQQEQKEQEPDEELIVKESHAISQAIAESQEACSDLINEDTLSEREPELVALDQKKECDDENAMESKLNPDAQEFVPSSPVNSIGGGLKENNPLNMLNKDEILAQSPRKGTPTQNALFDLPDADQFNEEISNRPHGFDGVYMPTSPTNYQEINLKEAMHGDEKKDESVEDTSEKSNQSTEDQLNDIIKNIPNALSLSETVPNEHDPMNMSYHQDVNDVSFTANQHDMNTVHLLPSKEELETVDDESKENGDVGDEALKPEEDMFQNEPSHDFVAESEKPESELEAATVLLDFAQTKPSDLVDFLVDTTVPQTHVNVTDLDSDLTGALTADKLSFEAEPFIPESQGIDLNSLPESESTTTKSQFDEKESLVEDSAESDHCFLHEPTTDLIITQEIIVESKVGTPPPTPAATNNGLIDMSERLTSPEPQKLMEAVEKLAEPDVAEEEKEKGAVEEMKTEKVEEAVSVPEIVAVATGVTLAAAAATAVAVTATKTAVKEEKIEKKTVTKKEEPKAKPRTTKPASAGVKSSLTAAAASPRTSLTAKAPAGKVSPVKPPSTLSTRPKSSPATTTATKSPLTAAKSPMTSARKPLASPLAPTSAASPRSTAAASRTTVTKTSPLTKANPPAKSSTVTAPKTATSTTAAGVKKTTTTATTTKNLSTKPTVLSARPKVPSTGATSGTVSSTTTTVTKTTRTTLSSAKPRVPSATTTTRTTTATNGPRVPPTAASKPMSATARPAAARPASATTKTMAPKPTVTSTLRKSADTNAKVSSTTTTAAAAARNGVKTTTTTTSTTAKRPGTLASRTTTTTTKKMTSTKVGGAAPTAADKKPTEVKKTVVEVTEKLQNGDLLHTTTTTEQVDAVEVKKQVESHKIIDNNIATELIIDLKND